jgi:hypothetical protein
MGGTLISSSVGHLLRVEPKLAVLRFGVVDRAVACILFRGGGVGNRDVLGIDPAGGIGVLGYRSTVSHTPPGVVMKVILFVLVVCLCGRAVSLAPSSDSLRRAMLNVGRGIDSASEIALGPLEEVVKAERTERATRAAKRGAFGTPPAREQLDDEMDQAADTTVRGASPPNEMGGIASLSAPERAAEWLIWRYNEATRQSRE